MHKVFLNYPDWQQTADTLHLYLQMTGKIKLQRCFKRPEWAHIRQYLTVDGLTTGIISGDHAPFEIIFNLRQNQVDLRNGEGKKVSFALHNGLSVAAFYRQLMQGLDYIEASTPINVRSQEFYDPVDLDKDEKHATYDKNAVLIFLDYLHFAYRMMIQFVAPFRGKVDFPAYYFGTMDLSCTIYSGEAVPLETNDCISVHAFDERSCEFGFWPGDTGFGKAAFYILPYPFVSSIQGHEAWLQPDKARFVSSKKEFFLTLEDAFSYPDPPAAIQQFFKSGFAICQQLNRWEHLEWITTPLH